MAFSNVSPGATRRTSQHVGDLTFQPGRGSRDRLTVEGVRPGIDETSSCKQPDAKENCPVSKALRERPEITLDAVSQTEVRIAWTLDPSSNPYQHAFRRALCESNGECRPLSLPVHQAGFHARRSQRQSLSSPRRHFPAIHR